MTGEYTLYIGELLLPMWNNGSYDTGLYILVIDSHAVKNRIQNVPPPTRSTVLLPKEKSNEKRADDWKIVAAKEILRALKMFKISLIILPNNSRCSTAVFRPQANSFLQKLQEYYHHNLHKKF